MHFDLIEILRSFGPYAMFAIWGIVFAESGLFFGFFLPGDSLLFTAGVLASQGFMPIVALAGGCFIAAVLGDSVGYWFGHKFGRKIFEEEKLPLVKKHHIETAEAFYKKHGKKTIILARFVPIVRTFAPIVAGIGSMNYQTFISYNLVGGFSWGVGMTLAGYFLGSLIPADDVDKYLLPIVAIIIIISVVPAIWHVIADKKEQKTNKEKLTADKKSS
ncbi:DedA family protein [Candidatus Woesebacteria bacterium]|nr:DedA family protein [Candidatus Woesebacteria bacterium]